MAEMAKYMHMFTISVSNRQESDMKYLISDQIISKYSLHCVLSNSKKIIAEVLEGSSDAFKLRNKLCMISLSFNTRH
jgi:hypothetical protein